MVSSEKYLIKSLFQRKIIMSGNICQTFSLGWNLNKSDIYIPWVREYGKTEGDGSSHHENCVEHGEHYKDFSEIKFLNSGRVVYSIELETRPSAL